MGFLSNLFRPSKPLLRLHSGSFSVDRSGRVLASTLPSTFPADLLRTIGTTVSQTFQEALAAQLPLEQLIVHYPGLKITAREMRGGAIVFLSTSNFTSPTPKHS
jgi:hypothetical protein